MSAGAGTVNGDVTTVTVTCVTPQQFAYLTNDRANTLSQFSIGADGNLTPLNPATVATGPDPANPFTIATGKGPSMIAIDRTGRFAYVPNARDDSISQYAIGADGTLTPLSTPVTRRGRVGRLRDHFLTR